MGLLPASVAVVPTNEHIRLQRGLPFGLHTCTYQCTRCVNVSVKTAVMGQEGYTHISSYVLGAPNLNNEMLGGVHNVERRNAGQELGIDPGEFSLACVRAD
jgi:hypothetical protein